MMEMCKWLEVDAQYEVGSGHIRGYHKIAVSIVPAREEHRFNKLLSTLNHPKGTSISLSEHETNDIKRESGMCSPEHISPTLPRDQIR